MLGNSALGIALLLQLFFRLSCADNPVPKPVFNQRLPPTTPHLFRLPEGSALRANDDETTTPR